MTPREPDRFEAQARELSRDSVPTSAIAAALRREREDALERAAQVAKQSQEDCFCKDKSDELLGGMPCAACMEAARIEGTLRGLAHLAVPSPEAPPTKECTSTSGTIFCNDRACTAHGKPVAPSLLPRVLAALESLPLSHMPYVSGLRDELRRYIEEMEGNHK